MTDPFQGRVAVVTGGASGIGLAMARAFAARGAKIALADIREDALAAAVQELEASGHEAVGIPTDVTKRESVERLAERVFERFDAAHIVCNNAGIAPLGSIVGASQSDWDKTMAVNLWGVVHGVDAFVPRLIEQKQGGHVVNTASMAGLIGMQYLGLYCVTKFAVVGLSESLERELRPHGIGVHALCPMMVTTPIGENSARTLGRDAPVQVGSTTPSSGPMKGGFIEAEEVADKVLRAIEAGRFYILTHPEQRDILRRRADRIDAVFDQDF
jgi:NAD(P)-dependent dehydrogenase (short-subunit alcohol dehydrogenase family)